MLDQWAFSALELGNSRRNWLRVCLAAVTAAIACLLVPQAIFAALSFSGDVVLNTGIPSAPAQIGRMSLGTLRLDNGSSFASGQSQLGIEPSGIGLAIVTGTGTAWKASTLDVGVNGVGRLEIRDGGFVEAASGLRIPANPLGHGTVEVAGPGSTLLVRSSMRLGAPGQGALLKISDGAIVNAVQTSTLFSPTARVMLDDGLLRLQSLYNNGLISGSGEVSFTSSGVNSGRLATGDGDYLRMGSGLSSPFQNQGLITIDGGEIEFLSRLTNATRQPNGRAEITLKNGTLRVNPPTSAGEVTFSNSTLLASIGGENHVYGSVLNSGVTQLGLGAEIAATNRSVMIFHDDVYIQNGMMTVFPGSKATLLEDLLLGSSAMLLADIAGSDIDTDYGEIEVVGNVQLGGQLQVLLSNNFVPAAGDSFSILRSLGGIDGSLTFGVMPPLPGDLVWDLDITPNQVLLNVVTAPSGDYNRDGTVDAADYAVWRTALGQSGAGLPADGNGDGVVDQADHAVWKSNFGRTAGSSAGASTTVVPEPTSMTLLALGALAALCRADRRRGNK